MSLAVMRTRSRVLIAMVACWYLHEAPCQWKMNQRVCSCCYRSSAPQGLSRDCLSVAPKDLSVRMCNSRCSRKSVMEDCSDVGAHTLSIHVSWVIALYRAHKQKSRGSCTITKSSPMSEVRHIAFSPIVAFPTKRGLPHAVPGFW